MGVIVLGNPWGLLGLLGVPAILAIHLLQRRAVIVPASTLFLLEQCARESEGGNRVERLRNSLPLWLQLLAVLTLTWLLTQPRRVAEHAVRRVAVVVDGSASMRAAKPRLLESLPRDLETLSTIAVRTEYFLIDSRSREERLYHGMDLAELRRALEAWTPSAGAHDPAPALQLARGLAGNEGLALYVTDHAQEIPPFGARLYACGAPVENAGIAGVSVEEADGRMVWRAVLRNYGKQPQTRWWSVESGTLKTAPVSVTLPPGAVKQVSAPFPDGVSELTLTLSPGDAFDLDDRAAVLRPRPKTVRVSPPPEEAARPPEERLVTAMFSSLPGVALTANDAEADLLARRFNALNPELPPKPACLFVYGDSDPAAGPAPLMTGAVLVERHPLTDGLNWQSLLCRESVSIPPLESDEPLVWQGNRALVFLRGPERERRLCFNFDFPGSNARRLPATIVTLHRFLEETRRGMIAEEHLLAECGQALNPVADTGADAPPLTVVTEFASGKKLERLLPVSQAGLTRAPDEPGFLEVRQGDRLLLRAAAHFADVREADFSKAETRADLREARAETLKRHTSEDAAWRVWVLVLLALIGAGWWFLSRPEERRRKNASVPVPVSVS